MSDIREVSPSMKLDSSHRGSLEEHHMLIVRIGEELSTHRRLLEECLELLQDMQMNPEAET